MTEAAAAHGYSRAAFYLVSASFEQLGMAGLLDERRGRRGPVKLRPEIVEFIRGGARLGRGGRRSGGGPVRRAAAPADRRTGPRPVTARSFWPPVRGGAGRLRDAARAPVDHDRLPDGLAAARFARRGLAGLIAWPAAEPVFVAELIGAARPAWTPHADPRMSALAAGYQFLLDTAAVLDAAPDCVAAGRGPR